MIINKSLLAAILIGVVALGTAYLFLKTNTPQPIIQGGQQAGPSTQSQSKSAWQIQDEKGSVLTSPQPKPQSSQEDVQNEINNLDKAVNETNTNDFGSQTLSDIK